MFASSGITSVAGLDRSLARAPVVWRLAATAAIVGISVAASDRADWQPLTLIAALSAAMVVADLAPVRARRIRISCGLMVQTTIMALLGPGPAAVIGIASIAVESPLYRVPPRFAANNALIIALLGLVGGVAFDALRAGLDLDRVDGGYALLVLPVYVALSALNLVLVAALQTQWPVDVRVRILRDTGVPAIPFELVNGIFAMAAVLVWAEAGIATAATLVLVLVVTMPLARTLADALRSGDDLRELRVVSDERAAEVARLASDRERLLSEVMSAEARERARLAESLHDGPMQRFLAIRQDAAESDAGIAAHLDEAITETRALISAFHPATVRELGFEASLRAAIAPFPAARHVALTVRNAVGEDELADAFLLPVAQELVVNAVKHADPSAIDVDVSAEAGWLRLEVNDDGVGIDSKRADRAVQAGHVGLAMVRRRVEDAGGRLEIATRRDGGTRSLVTLPNNFRGP